MYNLNFNIWALKYLKQQNLIGGTKNKIFNDEQNDLMCQYTNAMPIPSIFLAAKSMKALEIQ